MIDLNDLIEYDRAVTLSVNGSNSIFWDGFSSVFTTTVVWIPLAVMLLYMFIRNNNIHKFIWLVIILAITVFLCDQLSSSLCKPYFARFRPTQDVDILELVDTVNGYRGGKFGFISSHAANSFGISVFLILLIRDNIFGLSVISWAIINSLIRSYIGVHFVGDIVCGAIAGSIIGSISYLVFRYITRNQNSFSSHFSVILFTKSGYQYSDVRIFTFLLYSTYVFIIFFTLIKQGIYAF